MCQLCNNADKYQENDNRFLYDVFSTSNNAKGQNYRHKQHSQQLMKQKKHNFYSLKSNFSNLAPISSTPKACRSIARNTHKKVTVKQLKVVIEKNKIKETIILYVYVLQDMEVQRRTIWTVPHVVGTSSKLDLAINVVFLAHIIELQ